MKVFFTEANPETDVDAIYMAGTVLKEHQCVDERFIHACLKRETKYPTGLALGAGKAIAMPHGGADFIQQDGVSVLRTKAPIAFGRMEDATQTVPVQLVFNLAISSGKNHLVMLRRLMQLFQNETFLKECMTLRPEKAAAYVGKCLEEAQDD